MADCHLIEAPLAGIYESAGQLSRASFAGLVVVAGEELFAVAAAEQEDEAAGAHSAGVRGGFPFSTTYVASSAALPLPTFLTAWIAPAGMVKASPALNVIGGLFSI